MSKNLLDENVRKCRKWTSSSAEKRYQVDLNNILQYTATYDPILDACPICGSTNICKNGKSHGRQRYLCRDCGKTTTCTKDTNFYRSRLSQYDYRNFCECFSNSETIRSTARRMGLNRKTVETYKIELLEIHKEK